MGGIGGDANVTLQSSEQESTIYQNLGDAAKVGWRGKLVARRAHRKWSPKEQYTETFKQRTDNPLTQLTKKKGEDQNWQNWRRKGISNHRSPTECRGSAGHTLKFCIKKKENKLESLEEMTRFLNIYTLSRLNWENTKNLNSSIASDEIGAAIKSPTEETTELGRLMDTFQL